MKKIVLALAILFGVLPLYSQDIKVAQKNYNQGLTEVRRSFDGTTVALKGKLEYKMDNYLSINYDNGELFLIDNNNMTINRDGLKQNFDTSKNLMMKGLRDALLFSFQGKLTELATAQQATMEVSKESGNTVVTLTAQKKQVRGYSKIVVYYKPDGSIFKMQMDEFNGASTLYTLN